MKFKPRFRDDNVKFKAKFATTDSVINALEVTENGVWHAPNGVDGFNPVKVNVPIPDGFIKPEGTINITQDGEWDVRNFEKANVNVSVADIAKGLIEKNLTEVSHDSVETLGEYIFYNTPLTKASFPKVTTMQQYAFCEDKKLESVYAPLVEEIEGYCFANTKVLKGVNFPNLKQIRPNAFMGSAITEINFPSAISLAQSSFQGCVSLESVDLPNVTNLQSAAFRSCTALVNVNLPKPTRIYSSAFSGCTALKNIVLPSTAVFEGNVFENCYSLEKVDLPKTTHLGAKVFSNCYSLKAIILRKVGYIVVLGNAYTLQNCYHIHGTVDATYNPNGEKDGYIYVPKVYLEEYKTATNWSAVASQLRAIEDYPEICG